MDTTLKGNISVKIKDLTETLSAAEEKWSLELKEKEEFIRRRDHTIAAQIETINSISKEVNDLTTKNKKLEGKFLEAERKFEAEQEEKHNLASEKLCIMRKYLEARQDVDSWKSKYYDLKAYLRDEMNRRHDILSEDEEEPPTKISK